MEKSEREKLIKTLEERLNEVRASKKKIQLEKDQAELEQAQDLSKEALAIMGLGHEKPIFVGKGDERLHISVAIGTRWYTLSLKGQRILDAYGHRMTPDELPKFDQEVVGVLARCWDKIQPLFWEVPKEDEE